MWSLNTNQLLQLVFHWRASNYSNAGGKNWLCWIYPRQPPMGLLLKVFPRIFLIRVILTWHTDFTTNLGANCDCTVRESLRLHSGDEREELCCISFCPLLILLVQVGQTASYGQAGSKSHVLIANPKSTPYASLFLIRINIDLFSCSIKEKKQQYFPPKDVNKQAHKLRVIYFFKLQQAKSKNNLPSFFKKKISVTPMLFLFKVHFFLLVSKDWWKYFIIS